MRCQLNFLRFTSLCFCFCNICVAVFAHLCVWFRIIHNVRVCLMSIILIEEVGFMEIYYCNFIQKVTFRVFINDTSLKTVIVI
jgi:hypothetical protein